MLAAIAVYGAPTIASVKAAARQATK